MRPDKKSKTASLRPPKLGRRLQEAFKYAANQHDGQTRKQSAVPYLAHLMAVTALVLEAGGDEDMAIAALLHDVVEDCGGMPRLREIRKKFGARVAKIVEGCTDSFGETKGEWLERKQTYLRHLKHSDAETRLVSACDKLHNVRTIVRDYRDIGEALWSRFTGKREGSLWYYRALSDEYQRRHATPVTRELALAVAELEQITRKKTIVSRKSAKTRVVTSSGR